MFSNGAAASVTSAKHSLLRTRFGGLGHPGKTALGDCYLSPRALRATRAAAMLLQEAVDGGDKGRWLCLALVMIAAGAWRKIPRKRHAFTRVSAKLVLSALGNLGGLYINGRESGRMRRRRRAFPGAAPKPAMVIACSAARCFEGGTGTATESAGSPTLVSTRAESRHSARDCMCEKNGVRSTCGERLARTRAMIDRRYLTTTGPRARCC